MAELKRTIIDNIEVLYKRVVNCQDFSAELGNMLNNLDKFLYEVNLSDSEVNLLNEKLTECLSFMEKKDYMTMADLLKYEIEPFIEAAEMSEEPC